MLRFRHRMIPQKMKIYPEGGPEARLKKLRQIVTGLIRYERVEPTYTHAEEARQYAERLIYLAVKNGDKHAPTMETVDYWLLEKDLIHKLFKVIVPRYQNYYNSSYTSLHKLAVEYPGKGVNRGVLELKDNPWPPVQPAQRKTNLILSNILLSAARQDFYAEKRHNTKKLPVDSNVTDSSSSSSSSPPSVSSSVDIENSSSSTPSIDDTSKSVS